MMQNSSICSSNRFSKFTFEPHDVVDDNPEPRSIFGSMSGSANHPLSPSLLKIHSYPPLELQTVCQTPTSENNSSLTRQLAFSDGSNVDTRKKVLCSMKTIVSIVVTTAFVLLFGGLILFFRLRNTTRQ